MYFRNIFSYHHDILLVVLCEFVQNAIHLDLLVLFPVHTRVSSRNISWKMKSVLTLGIKIMIIMATKMCQNYNVPV